MANKKSLQSSARRRQAVPGRSPVWSWRQFPQGSVTPNRISEPMPAAIWQPCTVFGHNGAFLTGYVDDLGRVGIDLLLFRWDPEARLWWH